MTILCAVTCLLQFVGLVALTGVLVCLVAVLRLVELVITLINPFTIFVLHQSGKIIIVVEAGNVARFSWKQQIFVYLLVCDVLVGLDLFGLRKSKKLTSNAYHKIHMDCGRAPVLELEIGIRQPEMLYKRTVMSGLIEETFPREGDNYRAVQISEVASIGQDDEEQEMEVEKVDEDREIEKADDDHETEKSGSEEIGQTSDKEANET